MKSNEEKIHKTNTISSTDLDRFGGTVKMIRSAWDNLPDDIDMSEREMFVEIASKILNLQSTLRESDKDQKNIN